jgi:hypothetical protein
VAERRGCKPNHFGGAILFDVMKTQANKCNYSSRGGEGETKEVLINECGCETKIKIILQKKIVTEKNK